MATVPSPSPSPGAPGALPAADPLGAKLAALRGIIRGYGPSLVAFSGGVDSALVLAVATEQLGTDAVGLTAVSETMAEREIDAAAAFARALGARYEVVRSNELARPGFAQNPVDRCYHCKAELLELCEPAAARLGLRSILLGTNLDDLGDHRPGLVAARERGARQPLVEAGLSKAEVREVARRLGLSVWDKPQLACLSSRFPYGTSISPERLRTVDRFEASLHDLGFRQLRVRYHELPVLPGSPPGTPAPALARIELERSELPRGLSQAADVVRLGKQAGFLYVALDLEGFRSGSGNAALKRLPVVTTDTPTPAAQPHPAPAASAQPRADRKRKLVVAALVQRDDGAVLLSQRRADQGMPLKWELPGGKIEPGESPEAALRREIAEELGVESEVGAIYDVISHAYPEFDLLMLVYRCTLAAPPFPREVADVRFVPPPALLELDVLPADVPLMLRLQREAR
ncbi:MAG: ATP-dependent sacrificial sulfur transferase LarE [Polyangia bacterium]